MKWRCKDGREIELHEIETGHLKNIIEMLRRKGVVSPRVYFSCLAYSCSSDTPDGAAMAAETEWLSMKPWKGMELLEAELDKRESGNG